ncbi:hypothetical protein C8J57DRAFT_1500974 [Mycena rebaudengoi]|nr:hypothetical protein C8J57DRAFT_1500974 [Mycena rebaudengoi]
MATGQKPLYQRDVLMRWGHFVRSSADSPELLQDIREFLSFETLSDRHIHAEVLDNCHSILQWLKTFPDPPLDLIDIWEDYLMESCKAHSLHGTWDNKSLEDRWRAWQTDTSWWLPHHHHPMFQQDH